MSIAAFAWSFTNTRRQLWHRFQSSSGCPFVTDGKPKPDLYIKLDWSPAISTRRRPPHLRSNKEPIPKESLASALRAKQNTPSIMGSEVTIRSARVSDAEELHTISLCPGVRFNTFKMPYMPITKIQEQLEKLNAGDAKLVALIENRVIGSVGIHVNANAPRKHAAYIGMAVHDEFQGRGVGTSLLTESIDLAERWMGLRRLELEVFSRNTRAIEFYQRHGFEIEGRLKDYAFRDGEFVDAITMARVNGLERYARDSRKTADSLDLKNAPVSRVGP